MEKKQENLLANIAFNVALPVIILDQLTVKFGAITALVLALSLPIGYGIYDFLSRGEKNLLSLFGVVNVLLTGGLAIFKVQGIWFAVKEAAFPLIIGIFVLITAFTSKPAIKYFLLNPAIMNLELIDKKLEELGNSAAFNKLLKNSTIFFAGSFFISATLNFLLAVYIFKDIDPSLSEVAQSELLNKQIKEMTLLGYLVIALPLTVFMIVILMDFIKRLKKITGLETEELIPAMKNKA
ncbi:MAG: hypothetical protein MK008_09675 [Bdellovibrionales bacterium]|nr:hypothetical protein [Bdellovibrionales bacterium]